jgi:methyl-accepting chemotaxis protein
LHDLNGRRQRDKDVQLVNALSRIRLHTKLALLLGLFTLGLVASIAAGTSIMQQRMVDDRVNKLRAVVQSAIGIAKIVDLEAGAAGLTREQAIERLRATIRGMRFDDGAGYIIVRRDSLILLHGADPGMEGKPSSTADASGRPLAQLIQNALQGKDEGIVTYLFPKPGQVQPQSKISYVARFAPWQVVFFAGAYTDDLDAAFHATLLRLGSIGGVILLIVVLTAWLINRDIGGSLGKLRAAMERLAKGELSTEIPGIARRDEVGSMADAVRVFKEHMENERLTAAQEQQHRQEAAEKHAVLLAMVDRIESETTKAISEVGAHAAAMTATAEEMTASATRTGNSAQAAATTSAQALINAQTVARAADKLSAAIREISVQVEQSGAIVGRAVAAGTETRSTIEALNEQVGRIGAVADMIGEIAGKTNLLALNATIEAARAGEAGKGFAVVAAEVKALATQTARATQEIAQHIAQVRDAMGVSVAAVEQIEQTIGEIDAIAHAIAGAVQAQGAATAEIAHNVAESASAANEMTSRVSEVTTEADQTGMRAADVCRGAAGLNAAMGELRHSVIRVVRSAATEMNRRHERRYPGDLPCRLSVAGHSSTAQVADLSENGAHIRNAPSMPVGTRGALTIDGIDLVLPFNVRGFEDGGLHLVFELDAATAAKFRLIPERLAARRAA